LVEISDELFNWRDLLFDNNNGGLVSNATHRHPCGLRPASSTRGPTPSPALACCTAESTWFVENVREVFKILPTSVILEVLKCFLFNMFIFAATYVFKAIVIFEDSWLSTNTIHTQDICSKTYPFMIN
jgi:hypothetical protein